MRRIMKTLMIIMVIMMSLSIPASAMSKEIPETKYQEIDRYKNGFEISSSGLASCKVSLESQSYDRTVKVYAYIQRYENGRWITVKSGNARDSYYIFHKKVDENFTISDGMSISQASNIVIGFGGYLPPPYGYGFTTVGIFKEVANTTDAGFLSYTGKYVSSVVDQAIFIKYGEVYWDDYTWNKRALSEKRVTDGFYYASWYDENGYHDSETKEAGRIRIDTGLYYNNILSQVEYGAAPFKKFDYHTGTVEYNAPELY